MEQILTELLVVASFISLFVTALVEFVKKTYPKLPKKYLPTVSLFLGLFLGYVVWLSFDLGMPLAHMLWGGGIAGLSSVGLFEGVKKFVVDDAWTSKYK